MKNDFSQVARGTSGTNGTDGTNLRATNATNAANAMCQSSLNVEVSCFKDYNTPDNPVTISLFQWLTSTKYKNTVEAIRKEPNKDRRDEMKSRLPAITPSGMFTKRTSNSLVKHSGFIAVDIDHKENEHIGNYDELKEQICKISNVAYCGISVSGTGYFALIPIEDPDKHLQHFFALERAFKKLGIVIDPACKNVDRLRGYSYDSESYFNHNARTFAATYSEPKPKKIVYKPTGDNDAANVESCLNQLTTDITADYQTWFEIGCALVNALGESGRQYFHQVSRFYSGYSERETDRQFEHCLKGYSKITLATFFYHCKLAGIEPERHTIAPKPISRHSVEIIKDGPYLETLKDGRQILMHPEGYPMDWDIKREQLTEALEPERLTAVPYMPGKPLFNPHLTLEQLRANGWRHPPCQTEEDYQNHLKDFKTKKSMILQHSIPIRTKYYPSNRAKLGHNAQKPEL